jgi:hypothetical protein
MKGRRLIPSQGFLLEINEKHQHDMVSFTSYKIERWILSNATHFFPFMSTSKFIG